MPSFSLAGIETVQIVHGIEPLSVIGDVGVIGTVIVSGTIVLKSFNMDKFGKNGEDAGGASCVIVISPKLAST